MKGIGMFTGRIYESDERRTAQECVLCITDKQADDEEQIRIRYTELRIRCQDCYGCPEAQKML